MSQNSLGRVAIRSQLIIVVEDSWLPAHPATPCNCLHYINNLVIAILLFKPIWRRKDSWIFLIISLSGQTGQHAKFGEPRLSSRYLQLMFLFVIGNSGNSPIIMREHRFQCSHYDMVQKSMHSFTLKPIKVDWFSHRPWKGSCTQNYMNHYTDLCGSQLNFCIGRFCVWL